MNVIHTNGKMEERKDCFYEISNHYSKLTMCNSHGNVEFSYEDDDGYHACFTVDPDALRRMLDGVIAYEAAKTERERLSSRLREAETALKEAQEERDALQDKLDAMSPPFVPKKFA